MDNVHLVIDIGNSRIKYGLFGNGKMTIAGEFEGKDLHKVEEETRHHKATSTLISSTRTLTAQDLKLVFANHWNVLDDEMSLPFTNEYETPKTLGRDRIAAMAAVTALYPGKNCLVIDAGTCITYDLITSAGKYKGGAISPGIKMRLKAMNTFTDKLPEVEPVVENITFPGRNTVECMKNGSILAAALEINGFIDLVKQEFETLTVILTGGEAPLLADRIKTPIFAHSNLILIGLEQILNHNGL